MESVPFQRSARLSGPLRPQGQTILAWSQLFSQSLELISSISDSFYVGLRRKAPTVTLNIVSQCRLPVPKSQNPALGQNTTKQTTFVTHSQRLTLEGTPGHQKIEQKLIIKFKKQNKNQTHAHTQVSACLSEKTVTKTQTAFSSLW